jgi:hypothetical protein
VGVFLLLPNGCAQPLNEAGGVGGPTIELVGGDTEFDPAKSVLAAGRLVWDAAMSVVVEQKSTQTFGDGRGESRRTLETDSGEP